MAPKRRSWSVESRDREVRGFYWCGRSGATLGRTDVNARAAPHVIPRERVLTALAHLEPDRVPVDFLATPAVWDALAARLRVQPAAGPAAFFDPIREAVLRTLEVDLRVVSYDMFCNPPDSVLDAGAVVDWWGSFDRSTPNRMWRQRLPDGTSKDVWGIHRRVVLHEFGGYDELASCPLAAADSVEEVEAYSWPDPDWWDLSALPQVVSMLDQYHLRYRIGSVFETAWQLRGLQHLLVGLVTEPEIPRAIMARITDVLVEISGRVLDLIGDRIDLVYFYDDVAAQNSLLISPDTWRTEVRPHHARLTRLALDRGIPVMYHCDGAVARLIPELIDLGVNVLNPLQTGARGMEPARLKADFGDRLAFHGGVDIVETLPKGSPAEVAAEVRRLVRVLGAGGGYILCSSHHIQPDTPIENVLSMYDVELRYRAGQ